MTWAMIAVAAIGTAGAVGGSMLSKPDGESEGALQQNTSGMSITTPVPFAQRYWKDELRNMMAIKSGKMSPTDLPEFKRMTSLANTQSDQSLQRMIQMLGQKGITGGAAGQAISTAQTGANQNILKVIQDIYSQANQRGNNAAGMLGSRTDQQGTLSNVQNNMSQQPQNYQTPDLSNLFAALFRNQNQPSVDYSKYTGGWSNPSGSTWG